MQGDDKAKLLAKEVISLFALMSGARRSVIRSDINVQTVLIGILKR